MLRACFATDESRKRKAPNGALASSAGSASHQFLGSHGHLHKNRSTVAHAVLQDQEAAIEAIDQDIDFVILE